MGERKYILGHNLSLPSRYESREGKWELCSGSCECLYGDVLPWKATQLLNTSKATSYFSCPTSWCWTWLQLQQGFFFQACQLAYLVNFNLDSTSHVLWVPVTHKPAQIKDQIRILLQFLFSRDANFKALDRMGDTLFPKKTGILVVDSFWYLAKLIQFCKV